MANFAIFPSARHSNLVVEELENEILIYDTENAQASCLNPTASLVWKYADGKTSVSEIASKMSNDLGSTVAPGVVYFALEQLDKRNLLIERGTIPMQYKQMSRRDFLVKARVVGAAVAIPVIISIGVPTPAMAATCPNCLVLGQPQNQVCLDNTGCFNTCSAQGVCFQS